MTDTTTLLARALQADTSTLNVMLRRTGRPNDVFWKQEAERILATPEGQRIANVIEAAVAWRELWAGGTQDEFMQVSTALQAAIDALLEDET